MKLCYLLGSSILLPSILAQVPLIIDTDASFDVDDVVAICLAHALADRGEANILAIVHDAGIPEGIGAVSVLNHFYGRDDIVLGAYKGEYGKDGNGNWVRGHYVDHLVNNWDSPIRDSSQVSRVMICLTKIRMLKFENLSFRSWKLWRPTERFCLKPRTTLS